MPLPVPGLIIHLLGVSRMRLCHPSEPCQHFECFPGRFWANNLLSWNTVSADGLKSCHSVVATDHRWRWCRVSICLWFFFFLFVHLILARKKGQGAPSLSSRFCGVLSSANCSRRYYPGASISRQLTGLLHWKTAFLWPRRNYLLSQPPPPQLSIWELAPFRCHRKPPAPPNGGTAPFSCCPRFYGNLICWQFFCKLLQVCLLSRRLI